MIKYMLFVNGKPKMAFHENMVKYNPEDNTMTLTRLMVERKKNVRSYSGQ